MQLLWKVSVSTTCLHAVACFERGLPIADAETADLLQNAVLQFLGELQSTGTSTELVPQLVALSSVVENNRQLVDQAIARQWGQGAVNETIRGQLAGAISDLENALLRQRPQWIDEMEARSRPLREQWEARGPGLMRQITRLTDEMFLAPNAEVVLVPPLVGGHGWAHLRHNRVTFEAVLANPHPQLPETLRLGWFLSQLNADVPIYSERIPGPRLPLVAALATMPAVLQAAETVELAKLDAATLQQAVECWHLPTDLPADLPEQLLAWWHNYDDSSTRWPVALTALDALLVEAQGDRC